jgi:outer membrane receptor protein involved in Fe transport
MKVGRDWDDWRFALTLSNLFDEKYYSYGIIDTFSQCSVPIAGVPGICVYPQPGRSLFASAEYTFK